MTRPITTVKKEIRTLGLDACNTKRVIGAIVRGGLYLDGIVSFPQTRQNKARHLARNILETQYFPELRSVMIHDPKNSLDPRTIQETTRLPIIQVSSVKPADSKSYRVFNGKRGHLWVSSRLPPSILDKVISLTWTTGRLPEPTRVAHLIAGARIPAVLR